MPSVIPAASKAPTLLYKSAAGFFQESYLQSGQHSLVKIVQEPNSPRTIPRCKRLGQVNTTRNAGDDIAEPEDDARNHEHCDILGGGLDDNTYDGDHTTPEQRRTSAKPITHGSREERAYAAANEDAACVQSCRGGIEVEVVGIAREDIETVTCIVCQPLPLMNRLAEKVTYSIDPSYPFVFRHAVNLVEIRHVHGAGFHLPQTVQWSRR